MLDDTKYNVKGLTLPKGGCILDQTFANDTALYLKGTKCNMDRMRSVLDFFCFTSRAIINWGKFGPFGPAKRSGPRNGVKR